MEEPRLQKATPNEGEQLVLGLGPVQNSFHRLSRLVPILGVQKQFDWFRGRKEDANNPDFVQLLRIRFIFPVEFSSSKIKCTGGREFINEKIPYQLNINSQRIISRFLGIDSVMYQMEAHRALGG